MTRVKLESAVMRTNNSDADDEVDADGAHRHSKPVITPTLHTLARPPRTPHPTHLETTPHYPDNQSLSVTDPRKSKRALKEVVRHSNRQIGSADF